MLRSLEIELGHPELEAILYNLLLRMEQVGPIGLAIAWISGIVLILLVRGVLLAIVGIVWHATSTWAPRQRATNAAKPPPAPQPPLAGPWSRGPLATRPAPTPAPATQEAPPRSPKTVAPPLRPMVERAGRTRDAGARQGSVVLQRPRSHMDER